MKSLLLTMEYPPQIGGVGNYYYNLVKHWPQEGEIRVIDNSGHLLSDPQKRYSWLRTFSLIRKEQKNKSFDHLLIGNILPLGTCAYLAYLVKPYKYSVILHGLDYAIAQKKTWQRLLAKLILKRADKIICANTFLAQMIKKNQAQVAEKIRVVNPGIDPKRLNLADVNLKQIKDQCQLANQFVVLSIGRLVRRKGFDKMIEALALIPDKHVHYYLIGTGPDETYLKELARSFKVNERVHFLGAVSDETKQAWLDLCQVLVMPARQIDYDFEGFGIVFLEANLASKPVIAGNSGGIADAVEHNLSGFLVDPLNPQEIKDYLMQLKSSPSQCATLGQAGRERAIKQFNWTSQADKLFKVLSE